MTRLLGWLGGANKNTSNAPEKGASSCPPREVYSHQGLYPGEEHKMRTYTGLHVDPMNLRVEDVCIEDIAHALARQCRFNGHCGGFLSVAGHCVRVHDYLNEDGYGPEGLLHDAAEAYLGDIIRPMKYSGHFALYFEAEERAERVIAEAFGLQWPWPDAVKFADTRSLLFELKELWDAPGDPAYDELMFMNRFYQHW